MDGKQVFHTASTVGSVEGNVLIKAGNGLNVVGSNVIARQGDDDADRAQQGIPRDHKAASSVTASNPVVSAVQTGERMASAASKVDNPVMGLRPARLAWRPHNAYDAVQKMGSLDKATSLDKVGGSASRSAWAAARAPAPPNATHPARRAPPSRRADLTIIAQGAGRNSDITVTGSNLSAGGNAVLKAEGDVLLQAARNAFEQKTDSKSSSASIGVGFNVGSANTGVTLELGVSASRGKADGKDESWTNSHVVAGNTLAFQSGGDTTLKGASGKADQIIASVGGNLLLESLQDTRSTTPRTRARVLAHRSA